MTDLPEAARHIVVGILTFDRPDDLKDAIAAIKPQLDRIHQTAEILVIDNSSAGEAVSGTADDTAVRFVHEPSPGIAAARNRALDETTISDLLVFIDDDERPGPGWLSSLVETWTQTRAAAVIGPVQSEFVVEPEEWIRAGGFFDRRRPETLTEVTVAATNNLLLDVAQVRALGVRFDERFGIAGGSDTMFTRQLNERGGRMVWCAEAMVTDVVPADRTTRDWVLRRALRTGNSWSRVSLAMESTTLGRLRQRAQLTAVGLARIAVGLVRCSAGFVLRNIRHEANGARTTARGLGMATGAWGYTYVEYRRESESL